MATAKADTVDTPEGRFAGLHSRWTQYSELWEPFTVAAERVLPPPTCSKSEGTRLITDKYSSRICGTASGQATWPSSSGIATLATTRSPSGIRRSVRILYTGFALERRPRRITDQGLGHHFSAYEDTTPVPGLVASAHGVVLELGPGTGNQLSRFAAPTITHVYGVEPNTAFADALMARLASEETPAALRDRYTPVFCGVEDRGTLARQGVVPGSVDCVVSMQVLCSVERPREVAAWLYELLKPGGQVIFWEHCRSEDRVTRWVQRE